MAAPGRPALEEAILAAVGAIALTAERAEQLAEALAERGGIRRDDARAAIEEAVGKWRAEATRFTERAGTGVQGWLRELGLASRSDTEELELRVAQLEHRLKLLEADEPLVPPS